MRLPSGIDFENLDFDGIARCHHIGRLGDAMPGHVADVQQSIHAAQIDERAEIGDAANRSAHHRAFLQLSEFLLARPRLFLFQDHAAVHHHVFAGRVQLDDPALDLLAHQLLQLRLIFGAAARSGQERRQSDIHAQSALHQLR